MFTVMIILNYQETHVNTPGISSVVNESLQILGNVVPVREGLRQGLGAQHIPFNDIIKNY